MNSINSFLESAPIAGFIRQRGNMHRRRETINRFFSEYEDQINQTHFSGRQLPADVVSYGSLDEINRLAKQVEELYAEIALEEQHIREYEEEIAAIQKKLKQKQLVVNIALGILLLAAVIYLMSR